MPKREPWVMPEWMEKYRQHFTNTGGNSLEDLMNDHTTNGFNNCIRAGLIVAVESQVILLHRMKDAGMIEAAPAARKEDERG